MTLIKKSLTHDLPQEVCYNKKKNSEIMIVITYNKEPIQLK